MNNDSADGAYDYNSKAADKAKQAAHTEGVKRPLRQSLSPHKRLQKFQALTETGLLSGHSGLGKIHSPGASALLQTDIDKIGQSPEFKIPRTPATTPPTAEKEIATARQQGLNFFASSHTAHRQDPITIFANLDRRAIRDGKKASLFGSVRPKWTVDLVGDHTRCRTTWMRRIDTPCF